MNNQPTTTPSTQDEVLVKVEGVSKKFCRDLKKSLWYGVSDICSELNPFRTNVTVDRSRLIVDGTETNNQQQATNNHQDIPLDSNLRRDEFYAVRDVSFELRRGECLGLIGRNGAGKTTLLKMLNGLIKPDSGRIEMRGRIGALIALGAGFNPILTGRENVYVNGSVLGLTKKEIDEKFKEIVEFSEIKEFIDTPVRNYSSGMQVRLGFSIASTLSPDVLLVDEVLAVGDMNFRNRCLKRMKEFIISGGVVIIVSHQIQVVQAMCNRVIVMTEGKLIQDGKTADGINKYLKQCEKGESLKDNSERSPQGGALSILSCKVASLENKDIFPKEPARITVAYHCTSVPKPVGVHLIIRDVVHSIRLCTLVSTDEGVTFQLEKGNHTISFTVASIPFAPGKYYVETRLIDSEILFPIAERGVDGEGDSFQVERDAQKTVVFPGMLEDLIELDVQWK